VWGGGGARGAAVKALTPTLSQWEREKTSDVQAYPDC
jgi:hypothetical protein